MKTKHLTFAALAAMLLFQTSITQAAQKYSDWSVPVNLGPIVNSAGDDQGPAVCENGLSLYITSVLPGGIGGIDMWVSQRAGVEDPWGPPRNLGPNVNSPDTDGLPAFSRDGHWMFFNSNRPGGFGNFDLWACWRAHTHDDFGWQPAVNLGPGVNTASLDCCSSFFENEEAGTPLLYFTRELVAGDRDIYVSALAADGSFGPAIIVPELNSLQNDVKPTIRFDGLEIILLSNRTGSLGGNDLWSSTRATVFDAWSPPENLGPVVNTASNDAQPYLSSDGSILFFASNRPGGFGGLDFYSTTREKGGGKDKD